MSVSEILERSVSDRVVSQLDCFGIRKLNIKNSVSLLISSFDSIDETEMDFGLTFTMFQKWQEWIYGLVSVTETLSSDQKTNLDYVVHRSMISGSENDVSRY